MIKTKSKSSQEVKEKIHTVEQSKDDSRLPVENAEQTVEQHDRSPQKKRIDQCRILYPVKCLSKTKQKKTSTNIQQLKGLTRRPAVQETLKAVLHGERR